MACRPGQSFRPSADGRGQRRAGWDHRSIGGRPGPTEHAGRDWPAGPSADGQSQRRTDRSGPADPSVDGRDHWRARRADSAASLADGRDHRRAGRAGPTDPPADCQSQRRAGRACRFVGRWPGSTARGPGWTGPARPLADDRSQSREPACRSVAGRPGPTAIPTIPKYQHDRIQSVLNVAARVIFGVNRYDHITPLLKDRLHWLRVPQRIDFKQCLLVYKALHRLAPGHIADYCVKVSSNNRRSSLRSATHKCLVIPPPAKTAHLGERSFRVSGSSLWNALPDNVKDASSVDLFKTRLKTFLFGLLDSELNLSFLILLSMRPCKRTVRASKRLTAHYKWSL